MGDDFGVGVALEAVSAVFEFATQFGVVLDDPVVDDRNFSGAVRVGMSVRIRGRSVRTPSSVADSDAASAGYLGPYLLF